MRHMCVELVIRHPVFGAGGNRSAAAGAGKPEPVEVTLCEGHSGVEADDREETGHMQDGLDHLFTHCGVQVVQLGGVVPRKARAIIAVIDVSCLPRCPVTPAKHDRCVGLLVVVAFDLDLHTRVLRQVGAIKVVSGIGTILPRDEPVGMLYDPRRIDTHMVRHHVAGQPDAPRIGTTPQVHVSGLAAQVLGDVVIEE